MCRKGKERIFHIGFMPFYGSTIVLSAPLSFPPQGSRHAGSRETSRKRQRYASSRRQGYPPRDNFVQSVPYLCRTARLCFLPTFKSADFCTTSVRGVCCSSNSLCKTRLWLRPPSGEFRQGYASFFGLRQDYASDATMCPAWARS